MAQAARLNLRMQKELKLLLTDPPPGATFPDLSPTSDLSTFSLTAIDALIDGPEGTVYEKGVFKIKIQIPERYPFQPPVVTFSTPIYHPNIDTGGRICLDILNLPPKGAWRPSLNVSTVLTSIGLLLTEPNPDDGLMCEASKEYKYNKQVFDQKARSMTEKYARLDASPNLKGIQSLTDSNMTEDKAAEVEKNDMQEYTVGFKKLSGISRKLSLDASGSKTKESDMEINEIHSNTLIQEPKQDLKPVKNSDQFSHEQLVRDHDNKPVTMSSKKLCLSGKNLQHEVLDSTKKTIDCDVQKENLFKVQKEPIDRSCLTNPKRKKLGLTGKNLSLGFFGLAQNREKDNKVNTGSGASSTVTKLTRKPLQILEEKSNVKMNFNEGSLEQEGLCEPEGIIVLDSEDSEEEMVSSSSSRRFIARKQLLGK